MVPETLDENGTRAGDASARAPTPGYAAAGRSDESSDITNFERFGAAFRTGAGDTVALVPAPRRYTSDAIVLSRFDYGEADRILSLITPENG